MLVLVWLFVLWGGDGNWVWIIFVLFVLFGGDGNWFSFVLLLLPLSVSGSCSCRYWLLSSAITSIRFRCSFVSDNSAINCFILSLILAFLCFCRCSLPLQWRRLLERHWKCPCLIIVDRSLDIMMIVRLVSTYMDNEDERHYYFFWIKALPFVWSVLGVVFGLFADRTCFSGWNGHNQIKSNDQKISSVDLWNGQRRAIFFFPFYCKYRIDSSESNFSENNWSHLNYFFYIQID